MYNEHNRNRSVSSACECPVQITNGPDNTGGTTASRETRGASRGLLHFFAELRRRHVCRAATIYAVAFWLICQVVSTIAPELGMPEWTTRFVIIVGLIGFPIALTTSWLVDVTPEGLVIDHERDGERSMPATKRRGFDRVVDCSLVAAALLIAAHLATGLLSSDSNAATAGLPKITVIPTHPLWDESGKAFADGLFSQIQHELVSRSVANVLPPIDDNVRADCYRLTVTVAASAQAVRVTAMLIDNKTGFIDWSRVFNHSRDDSLDNQSRLANEIVGALPVPFAMPDTLAANEVAHVR